MEYIKASKKMSCSKGYKCVSGHLQRVLLCFLETWGPLEGMEPVPLYLVFWGAQALLSPRSSEKLNKQAAFGGNFLLSPDQMEES